MESLLTGPVVVVGAGLAGSRTCIELRKQGYQGEVILIGEETSLPYDRPPLSKNVLSGKRDSKPFKADYEGLGIDLRLGTVVKSVDLARGTVETTTGAISYGHLVIASGATPLRLPGTGEQLTLRTDQDTLALRDRLVEGSRVVVIGASWIGAEVAHIAIQRGCKVTGLEFHEAPLAQTLGADLGARFGGWWEGGELRISARVTSVEPDGVHLDSGEVLPADVVVTGIGVRAATGWLDGSGLELLPAVAVDGHLRTTDPRVYALGDAATWWSRRYGRLMDVQHWDDAYNAPAVVASGILYGPDSTLVHDPVPYFWSDQFGHRIEYVGHHSAADTVTIDEDFEKGWTARWTCQAGKIVAALAVDQPKLVSSLRASIAAATEPPSPVRAGQP